MSAMKKAADLVPTDKMKEILRNVKNSRIKPEI